MNIINALLITSCEKINNQIFKRDLKHAQPKAYKSACKKSGNRFDPDWHSKYKKQLAHYQQNAKENKELRSTFITNLFR